jgi:hypothetical protein
MVLSAQGPLTSQGILVSGHVPSAAAAWAKQVHSRWQQCQALRASKEMMASLLGAMQEATEGSLYTCIQGMRHRSCGPPYMPTPHVSIQGLHLWAAVLKANIKLLLTVAWRPLMRATQWSEALQH